MGDVLTIGEVAQRSGVATSALRFYEEQGLIHSERNDSGHRRYPRAVIRRVAFIVFAQTDRIVARGDSRGAGQAAAEPRAGTRGLGEAVERLDGADSRAHRRARAAGGGPDRVHRLRLPVTGSLPVCANPGDRAARRGAGSALLDGTPTGLIKKEGADRFRSAPSRVTQLRVQRPADDVVAVLPMIARPMRLVLV